MVEKAKKAKRRKILVTGSGGMLGTALCPVLSRDYEVVGLDLLQSTVHSPQSTDFVKCDIADKEKTMAAIENARPDLIIHTAAWTDVDGCEKNPDKAERVNAVGTANVALSAKKLDIPLIYVSTDYVFDGRKKTPYNETDKPNPINVYARSKLEGEKTVLKLGEYIILRTSWLFGAKGKNFVDTVLDKTKKEKSMKIVDDQIGCPTYAKDFAFAIKELLDKRVWKNSEKKALRKIYHVANKGMVSWFDYAREVLALAGIKNVKLIPINSDKLARTAKRPLFSALDTKKFSKATGFTMRPWREALAEYLRSCDEYKSITKKDKG